MTSRSLLLVFALTPLACSKPAPAPATATATASASVAPAVSGPAPFVSAKACPAPSGITCRRFPSVEEAFRAVLAEEPSVLAVGEAHAQKGSEAVASATKRFTDAMVPVLGDRASDLLLEAWAGDPRCAKEVKTVASAQAPVKQAQAESNPNEYVAMGTRAKAAGIQPHLLRPTCDDYASLADAGADVVTASLALIKRLTQADVMTLHQRNTAAQNGKMVVTYGGAMHNDLAPSEKLASYSFGPELARATNGRYVELDLIVPEYVKDTEVWQKLPWFAAWRGDAEPKDGMTTLYRLGTGAADRSYVLIFPSSAERAK